jgi:hypothetical protein
MPLDPIVRRFAVGLACAGATLAPTFAHAQAMELKPARLEYEFYPSASVRGSGVTTADGDVRFQSARASLSVPTPVGRETLLIPGFRYQLLDVGQETAAGPTEPVEALHSLVLSLGVLQPLTSDVSLFMQVGGGVAGDLSGELTSDDWVVSAQALGLWTISDGFTLGAGVGYDRRTGDVTPLPLVAFNWEPQPDLLVRAVLPQFLALRYRVANPVTLGVEASLDGERYHLNEQGVDLKHVEVAHSVAKLGPSVTLHWTPWLHTRLSGGVVLSRRFELYVDDISQGDLDVSRSPFAGLELWFGPSGWSSDAVETAMTVASNEPPSP